MYVYWKKGEKSPQRTNVFGARVTGLVLMPLSRARTNVSRTGSTWENEVLGQGRNKLSTYYLPILSSFILKKGIAGTLCATSFLGSTSKTRFSWVVFPLQKTGLLGSNQAFWSRFFNWQGCLYVLGCVPIFPFYFWGFFIFIFLFSRILYIERSYLLRLFTYI